MTKPTRRDLDRHAVPHITTRYASPDMASHPSLPQSVAFHVNQASLVIGNHRTDFNLGGSEQKDVTTGSPVGGPPLGFAPLERGGVVSGPRRRALRRTKLPTVPITDVASSTTELMSQGKAPAPPPGRRPTSRIWAD